MTTKLEPNQKLGPTIQAARQRRGLSLRQLGERLRKEDGSCFSPQYINDIEHGRRIPPDDLVMQLSTVLELPAEVMLQLTGRQPPEVKEYFAAMPGQSEPVGRLFRKARENQFSDWDALLKLIEGQK
jgi:transcriptional regulator with XRE-family HTH domain